MQLFHGDAGAMTDLAEGYVNERLDAYLETLASVNNEKRTLLIRNNWNRSVLWDK